MATIIIALASAALAVEILLARVPGTPGQRARARALPLTLIVIALTTFGLDAGAYTVPAVLVIAAGLLACVAPAIAARTAPLALTAYGVFGIGYWNNSIARPAVFYGVLPITQMIRETGWMMRPLGVIPAASPHRLAEVGYLVALPYNMHLRSPIWTSNLVLPEALIFVAVGLWLLNRSGAPGAAQVRALGNALRHRGPVPPALLLLVVLGWVGVDGVLTQYLPLWVILLAGSAIALYVAKRPAAYLAVAGLGLFALYGLLIAVAHAPADYYGVILVHNTTTRYLAGAEGLALLAVAARLWRSLGNSEVVQLTQRVERLTLTRSVATDSALTELKRIERDLHDGAQARLVAVGMSLRAAEQLMPDSPQAALALITEARQTSVRALEELRDLVRGIYPPMLADRGLNDALQSLALDAPLPVDVDVDLPDAVVMPLAAAVYFAVAEALANAVRHSGATTVQIRGFATDRTLRVEVTDNGGGGADASRGTGLAGVERRLATFDGILAISSPVGGPTIVVIEVPCALSSAKISIS
jgi:signal transduction histidine kinase